MGEWKSKNHSKYLLQYHLIFVCKYQKKLLFSAYFGTPSSIRAFLKIVPSKYDFPHRRIPVIIFIRPLFLFRKSVLRQRLRLISIKPLAKDFYTFLYFSFVLYTRMINKTIVCKGFLHLFYKFFCKTLFSLKIFIQTDKVFQSIFTTLPGTKMF